MTTPAPLRLLARVRRLAAPAVLAAVVGLVSLAVAAPAQAAPAPPTPSFGPEIEGFASYDGARTCLASVTQPGVARLEALLKATYGKTSFDTWRACSGSTATSEHNEGRALDFMLDSTNASDVAIANAFGVWLFATDQYGNAYANARRLGIMYIIWHGRMWRAYDVAKGWQPYTGGENHNDHMHISLSWAGARATTTFWNPISSFAGPMAPATTPSVYVMPGQRVYQGHQWSTTCQAFGTDGGRRCFANVYTPVIAETSRGWATVWRWVRHTVNDIDYLDNPYWDTAITAQPGTYVWAGQTYRTVCPAVTSTSRSCHTEVWVTKVVLSGSTYVRVWAWQTYSQVFLVSR